MLLSEKELLRYFRFFSAVALLPPASVNRAGKERFLKRAGIFVLRRVSFGLKVTGPGITLGDRARVQTKPSGGPKPSQQQLSVGSLTSDSHRTFYRQLAGSCRQSCW